MADTPYNFTASDFIQAGQQRRRNNFDFTQRPRFLGEAPNADFDFNFDPMALPTSDGIDLTGTANALGAMQQQPVDSIGSLARTTGSAVSNGAEAALTGTGGGGGGGKFNLGKAVDVLNRGLGDILALTNFGANQDEINNMPITQPFSFVQPVTEDETRRDAATVNEIRRQARQASLGTTSGSAQREGNLRAIANAGALNEINRARTAEDLRLDSVRARNAQRGQQSNMMNAGIFNQQMGDINQNLFTQSQARVANRQALTDSVMGNQFQRANQDLERERMAMIAMRDNDRGTLRRIYANMLADPNVSDTLKQQVESYLNT